MKAFEEMDNSARQLIADELRSGAAWLESEERELTDGEFVGMLVTAFGGYADVEPGQKPDAAKAAKRDVEFFRRIAEAVEPAQAASGGIETELRAIRLLLAEQAASRAEQSAEFARILKHGFEDMRDDASQLRETLKFLR